MSVICALDPFLYASMHELMMDGCFLADREISTVLTSADSTIAALY